MRKLKWVILALVVFGALFATQAWAADKQIVIYMQCGGTQGDGATLARTNGARAAAAANNVKLIEQYSKWDQQTMIDQFKQAMAAHPDGIEIMGHPGEAAFAALVDEAEAQGIIVTSGNNPLPNIEASSIIADESGIHWQTIRRTAELVKYVAEHSPHAHHWCVPAWRRHPACRRTACR